jgi:hypothetical protein
MALARTAPRSRAAAGACLIATLAAHVLLLEWMVHGVGQGARENPGQSSADHAFLVWVQSSAPGAPVSPPAEPDKHPAARPVSTFAPSAAGNRRAAVRILERASLQQRCWQDYSDPMRLAQAVAGISVHAATPGGPGSELKLQVVGANERSARAALQCLQLFGTFGPQVRLKY